MASPPTGGARHPQAAVAGRPRRHPVRRPGRHQRRLRRDQGLVPQPRRRRPPRTSTAPSPAIGDFPGKAKFDADYKAEYGTDPTGYSATGYACAQVIIDALGRAGATADRHRRPSARPSAPRPSTRPHLRHRSSATFTLRRERRHEPEDRLVLLVRRRPTQGLEVRRPRSTTRQVVIGTGGRGSTDPRPLVITPTMRREDPRTDGPS